MIKCTTKIGKETYVADLTQPLDISIPLISGAAGPKCFDAPDFHIEPVRSGSWVGSTAEGGIVNFKNVSINPHGNGTHTECVGHISKEPVLINQVLTQSIFPAQLITIQPEKQQDGDKVINEKQISEAQITAGVKALIIRTTPNDESKLLRDYSETNPPYLTVPALKKIVDSGIEHLLIDLPSVDREYDEGKLAGHRAFWDYPRHIDLKKTISELIFASNSIKDGLYLCEIQIINIALDASPSRPQLYKLIRQ